MGCHHADGRSAERAVAEIRDVERISREALGEVRKAVRGYRSEGLLDEVANAAGTVGYELMCALAPRVPIAEVG